MPFVSAALLRLAVDDLKGKHVLAVLVLPAMLRAGVRVVNSPADATKYGSGDELDILNSYFRFPGGLPGKPYRAIWESNQDSYWRDDRFPGRSLQRQRKDRANSGRVFVQVKGDGGDLWGLTPACGPELKAWIATPVSIAALAVWYGREWDVRDLESLVGRFLSEFPLNEDELLGTAYDTGVPASYPSLPLLTEPIPADELAEIIEAQPPAPSMDDSVYEFANTLFNHVTANGFVIDESLIQRIVRAWLRGDIVVLVGQPGTGKTRLAQLLSEAIKGRFDGDVPEVWVAVHPDFDQAELIGYTRLDGTAELRPLAKQILLSPTPLGPHLVVLDEFNLESLENYFAPVLVATQDPQRRVSLPAAQGLPGQDHGLLPVDAFILATCNSYIDEPETRHALSAPARRRCTIITMPNYLFTQYQEQGAQAIGQVASRLIELERKSVEDRIRNGNGATFDNARLLALQTVGSFDSFTTPTRDRLVRLVKALLDDATMAQAFTMGLLRDVALDLALVPRTEADELEAIGAAVADKILHQLRGTRGIADEIKALSEGLPNQIEISRLLDRMLAGPADELLPLV